VSPLARKAPRGKRREELRLPHVHVPHAVRRHANRKNFTIGAILVGLSGIGGAVDKFVDWTVSTNAKLATANQRANHADSSRRALRVTLNRLIVRDSLLDLRVDRVERILHLRRVHRGERLARIEPRPTVPNEEPGLLTRLWHLIVH
jgi:hypothetical protein